MTRTIIIAEAGVNHNGDIRLAAQMIQVAAECGADYIKFQTFRANRLASHEAQQATYQKERAAATSQLEMLQKLELDEKAHEFLIAECHKHEIGFLSSPFDLESIELLKALNLDFMKIPSGEITNYPYLRAIAQLRKKTILSTGMATMEEVSEALDVLYKYGLTPDKLSLLHCTTEYPCPYPEVNLNAMLSLHQRFNVPTGYSDHTPGIEVSVAAVALGACIIEKHFTLDKSLPGPDHKASLEPKELKSMISAIRHIEASMGDGLKKPGTSELNNLVPARKSIHSSTTIKKGELFTENNLISLRPGDGISPMEWENLIGKKALRDIEPLQKIRIEDFRL